MTQEYITIAIVSFAVLVGLYRIFRSIRPKTDNTNSSCNSDNCSGCSGCNLSTMKNIGSDEKTASEQGV